MRPREWSKMFQLNTQFKNYVLCMFITRQSHAKHHVLLHSMANSEHAWVKGFPGPQVAVSSEYGSISTLLHSPSDTLLLP